MNDLPHVVIVGGGFGGLYCAKALKDTPCRVTLVDRRNHHLFQPLLYQVATAALSPSDIAYPIRSVFRGQRNVTVLLGEVVGIDKEAKQVALKGGDTLSYDFLVVATGATHSYFGHDEWAATAPGLKTLEDAVEIRRRVLLAFEAAEREDDPEKRRAWLTFVIVGGGATGVELAGAFAEIARHTLARDFRRIDPKQARVLLLEGGPAIVPVYPAPLPASAADQLEHMGVEVRVGAKVTGIDAEGVLLGAERIAARTVVWAAGVKASPLGKLLGAPLDRAGRVHVTPTLNVPGHDDIYVIGDLAHVERDGQLVPGVAPAAMQMGRHVAQTINRILHGETPRPFEYLDKGSMATIGRKKAIALLPGGIKLAGWIAWAAWLFVHILYLVGFRNRLFVLLSWAWSYVTWQRGARLITGGVDAGARAELSPAAKDESSLKSAS